tara:strand:+ start:895 stop:1305 length:411 start_codon:yes stop_codon:yes gene_type:complete
MSWILKHLEDAEIIDVIHKADWDEAVEEAKGSDQLAVLEKAGNIVIDHYCEQMNKNRDAVLEEGDHRFTVYWPDYNLYHEPILHFVTDRMYHKNKGKQETKGDGTFAVAFEQDSGTGFAIKHRILFSGVKDKRLRK